MSNAPKRYRMRNSILITLLVSWLVMVTILVIFLLYIFDTAFGRTTPVLIWAFIGFILLVIAGSFLVIVMPPFLSFLRVSREGLEYRWYPSYHIKCTWDDVIGMAERSDSNKEDVLLLKTATSFGQPVTKSMRRNMSLPADYVIPLSNVHGWKDGTLRAHLHRYIPTIIT